ncbi:MAG: ATPase, T2SS/T4P/T4SS family [Candidatus Woesearchaeota archaeon]
MTQENISPALQITKKCENYNEGLEEEGKSLCTNCMENCPYTKATGVSPIHRDEFTGDVKVCIHCDPKHAECLKACRKEGNGAMDVKRDTIVIEDTDACVACEEKPCIDACVFDGIVYNENKQKYPIKCDLCEMWKEKTNNYNAELRCVDSCPVDAIDYRGSAERLWVKFSGIKINPALPDNARKKKNNHEKKRKQKVPDVDVYEIPDEPHNLYHFNLPGFNLNSDRLSKLLNETLSELIGDFASKISQRVDTRRLDDVSYINSVKYQQIEKEIKKHVQEMIPNAMKRKFRYNGKKIKYQVIEKEGKLVLKYQNEKGKQGKIPIPQKTLTKIAEIVEALTHGPGILKFLLQDPNLEEIMVNGASKEGNISIWVYDKKYGHCKTNLKPTSQPQLRDLANKLLKYTNTDEHLSPNNQLISAQLPTGGRLQVVGPERAENGTSLTIRQYIEDTKSPIWLVNAQDNPSITPEGLAMIWELIEPGLHYMCIGGTGTGKTTFLDISTQLFPPSDRIISIQDVPEINIWKPNKTKTIMGKLGSNQSREEAMNELVKASLRMRPDRLIFGEARGGEARSLFGAALFAGGAPRGVSATLHVDNPEELVERVKLKPMEIPTMHVMGLDLIVSCKRKEDPNTRKPFRYVDSLAELKNYENDQGSIPVQRLWEYDLDEMDFVPYNYKYEDDPNVDEEFHSILYEKCRDIKNISKEEFWEDYREKAIIMRYLNQKRIEDAKKFVKILDIYYSPVKKKKQQLIREAKKNVSDEVKKNKIDRFKDYIISAA